MKLVNDIVSDLVEKKLWPVAAILAALAVAVPMMLSKPGSTPAAPPVPPITADDNAGPQLALTRATTTGFSRAPRVATRSLDPFADRSDTANKKAASEIESAISDGIGGTTVTPSAVDGGGVTPVKPSSGGGSGGSGGSGGGSTPSTKTETDDVLSVMITKGTGEPEQLDGVRTLSPLPDSENPFLVYLGKTSSGDASFLVSADATPSGEGTCDPSPQDCRTLTLSPGQTETFKLTDASTVDVTMLGVETKKVTVEGTAAKAARLETKARKVGAKVLLSVLDDPSVVSSLRRQHIRYRF